MDIPNEALAAIEAAAVYRVKLARGASDADAAGRELDAALFAWQRRLDAILAQWEDDCPARQ